MPRNRESSCSFDCADKEFLVNQRGSTGCFAMNKEHYDAENRPRSRKTIDEIFSHPHLWSRDVIKERFDHTRDLTVMQIIDTILHRDDDKNKGADQFIHLMNKLIRIKKGPFASSFKAKWLISDTRQLRHVMSETKIRDRSLFNILFLHSTVAVIEESDVLENKHLNFLREFDTGSWKTITAFPAEFGGQHDYYGHFAPPANEHWDNGPLCIQLKFVSYEIHNFLKKLDLAHLEKLGRVGDSTIKELEGMGVIIRSLEELIQ